MKIVKPMHVPPKISQSKLQKNAIGKEALGLVKEGLKKGYLKGRSVSSYLRKISKGNKNGTCFGQASAVIIADKNIGKGKEAKVVAKADKTDALGMQLMQTMEGITHAAVDVTQKIDKEMKPVTKKIEKIDDKIEKVEEKTENKANKKALKKLEDKKAHLKGKVKKTEKKVTSFIEKKTSVPFQLAPIDKIDEFKNFSQKVKETHRKLVEIEGDYEFVGKKEYSQKERKDFLKYIKKLATDKSEERAVRLALKPSKGMGHAIALFGKPKLSIYDQNIGLITCKNDKEFVRKVERIYCPKGVEKKLALAMKADKFSLEIFKRKP